MSAHPDLSVPFFQELISGTESDVSIKDIEVTTGAGRGDNYTSMLYRVRALGSKGQDPWTKSFICKCLPASRVRREAFKSEILFNNEVAFYTRALPALLSFQVERGISIFQQVPKVYLAKSHIIVLEDLKEKNFTMTDRKKGLDIKHCQAIVKTLGHFHGVSFSLKTVSPEKFATDITGQVRECLFREEYEGWYREYYKRAGANALKMVKETLLDSATSQKYIERFERFMDSSFFSRMVKDIKPVEPMAVLCHGDCWTNNFLFKYEDNGEISELCMVDFQFVRYGSPALDLVQLLFPCSNKALRAAHMSSLLFTYSIALQEAMDSLGCPSDALGRRETLSIIEQEIRRCSRIGLGLAVDMIPICTCDSEHAPDVYLQSTAENEQSNSNGEPSEHSSAYNLPDPDGNSEATKQRMTDLVVELVDAGVI